MISKIAQLYLYASQIESTLVFYTKTLGMKLVKQEQVNDLKAYHLSYGNKEASLVFVNNPDFKRQYIENEGYWKIALSVEDLSIAREALLQSGVDVGPAFQVPEVAYLCHFKDPEGYTIELIQHKFEVNHVPKEPNIEFALKTPTVFSLITYRAKYIYQSLKLYQDIGMRLLSVQDVSTRGFTLYFLAFTEDVLPNEDVTAIENREWLWQRPYTILELQHVHHLEKDPNFKYDASDKNGFLGLGIFTSEESNIQQDPDGYNIKTH